MQVHYVLPIVVGVVIAVWLLVWIVLVVRVTQVGRPPPLNPALTTTIVAVVVIGGSYLILRPDGRTDDMRVTEFLTMLGAFFVVIIVSIAPVILLVRWLAPTAMPDEEQKRTLETELEQVREQMEKWQERSTQRMLLWHVPTLLVGAIVIAAVCVIVLAQAFMR